MAYSVMSMARAKLIADVVRLMAHAVRLVL